jgi:hypothetical protein
MEQNVEEGIRETERETDRGKEDEMMENESKYDGSETNIYSIEYRTGDESGGLL